MQQSKKGWAWCFVPVFIGGFFVKTVIMAREVQGGVVLTAYLARYLPRLTSFQLACAVEVFALCFLIFMTSTVLLPAHWGSRHVGSTAFNPMHRRINLNRLKFLLSCVLVVFLLTIILPPILGFGQMGLQHRKLPFRLDAFITRTRIDLIPFLMVVLIWLLDRREYRKNWVLVVVLYLFFSLGDAWMRGSRSSLALAAIPMLTLWVSTNKLNAARKAVIAACGILVVLAYPFFTALRLARVRGTGLLRTDYIAAVSEVFSVDGVCRYIDVLIGRLQGVNGLLLSLDYQAANPGGSSLVRLVDQSRMALFHTHRVAGVPDDIVEGCAPGFLGGLINAGGVYFMYGAVFATPYVVHFFWQKLRATSICPAALAFGSLTLFLYINEGTFGVQTPVAFSIALIINVAVTKWLLDGRSGVGFSGSADVRV